MQPQSSLPKPNPPLRIAALVALAVVLFSVGYAWDASLEHSDIVRPTVLISHVPERIGFALASSELLYIPPSAQRTAISRIVHSGSPLYCGGVKKYAALTFDDGPSLNTPKLLAQLRRYGVPGTFFAVGRNVTHLPDYARAMPKAGATGNHTWDHAALDQLSRSEVRRELTDTDAALASTAGPQFKIMRPPYGARSVATNRVIRRMGYMQTLWSSDTGDGLNASVPEIVRTAKLGLGPGAIILMHDRPANTLKALRKILPAIRRSGLTMLTVPELLVLNPPSDRQLADGARGCSQAGKLNVSGDFEKLVGER